MKKKDAVTLFMETQRIYENCLLVFHEHHVALTRMRGLMVRLGSHNGIRGELSLPMASCLEHLDATVVHVVDKTDIMRLGILNVTEAVLQLRNQSSNVSSAGDSMGMLLAAKEAIKQVHWKRICSWCEKHAAATDMVHCTKCETTSYCSRDCKRKHRKRHTRQCKTLQ